MLAANPLTVSLSKDESAYARQDLSATLVIPAKAEIQIGCGDQALFPQSTLDSSVRWNDD